MNKESKKSDFSSRKSLNIEVYRDVIGRWNGQKLEDGNHGFREGDLVWAKVKGRPWWPAQIYDPINASELALKHSQAGRLLVAFFGDGSCSWCLPSQVLHFLENFNQMSSNEEDRSSFSKSLLNAVQKAVDEVGRVVESRLTCKCVPNKDHLARPVAANAGVKAGVLVPEVDIDRFIVPEYEPNEILKRVVNLGKGVRVGNTFELGVLRSSLSAFYNAKCGHPLPVCNEPFYIQGMEYNNDNETGLTTPKRLKTAAGGGELEERSSNGPSSIRKTRSQTRRVMQDDSEERPKRNANLHRERKKIRRVTFADEMPSGKKLSGQQKRVGGSRETNGRRLSFSESDVKLISDVRPIKANFDRTIETLNSCSEIPSKEKERLNEETNGLMEYVVTVSNPHCI